MAGSIINAMLAIPQVASMGARAGLEKAQKQIQQAQEQRQAQLDDQAFHEHMISLGALPIVNGMVKDQESLTAPASVAPDQTPQQGPSGESSNMLDADGNPNPGATFSGGPVTARGLVQAMMPGPQTGNITIVRKADPSNTVKWKDATGDTLAYELPSPESQRWRQMMALKAEAMRQQAASEAQGRAEGTAAGTPMVPTTPEYNTLMGLPPGMTQIPQPMAGNLAGKYVPANQRAGATEYNADAATARSNHKADLAARTAQAAQDLKDNEFQQREADQNKWEQTRDDTKRWLSTQTTGRQKISQDATSARNFVNNYERNTELYTNLGKNILGEQQKQIAAGALLGTDATGAPNFQDGEQFTDPFDGKPKTMNSGQRIILRSRLAASQKATMDMQASKLQLESMRDGLLQKIGGGSVPSATPSPATPAATPAAPAASAPPSSSRPPANLGADGFNGATTTGPGTPTHRPPNWADGGRQSSAAGTVTAPGRPAPVVPYKVGDTKSYNGRTYRFDGKQWVGQ